MNGWFTFGFGLLGGIIAWFGTMVIGHPFYSLLNLRFETARMLQLYEPPSKDDRGMSAQWLAEREAAYRSCAPSCSPSRPRNRLSHGLWEMRCIGSRGGRQSN